MRQKALLRTAGQLHSTLQLTKPSGVSPGAAALFSALGANRTLRRLSLGTSGGGQRNALVALMCVGLYARAKQAGASPWVTKR